MRRPLEFPQAPLLPRTGRPSTARIPALRSMPTLPQTRTPKKPEVPTLPQPKGPNFFPTSSHPRSWDWPYRPPPHSAAAWARSPARFGPLSVQHELAEAAPEGAACEQHRTQLHDQLQHPPSRTHLRRHLGEGQSAAASPPTGRPARGGDTQLPALAERRGWELGAVSFPPDGKPCSRSLVPDRSRCSLCGFRPFPLLMAA